MWSRETVFDSLDWGLPDPQQPSLALVETTPLPGYRLPVAVPARAQCQESQLSTTTCGSSVSDFSASLPELPPMLSAEPISPMPALVQEETASPVSPMPSLVLEETESVEEARPNVKLINIALLTDDAMPFELVCKESPGCAPGLVIARSCGWKGSLVSRMIPCNVVVLSDWLPRAPLADGRPLPQDSQRASWQRHDPDVPSTGSSDV
jgi:hypothetical protein